MSMLQTVNRIVDALVLIVAEASGQQPRPFAKEVTGIHVAAMFNWTKAADAGAVGWQMQVIYQILGGGKSDKQVEIPVNALLQMVETFQKHRHEWTFYSKKPF